MWQDYVTLTDDGWTIACDGCGKTVTEDNATPGASEEHVYCSEECCHRAGDHTMMDDAERDGTVARG